MPSYARHVAFGLLPFSLKGMLPTIFSVLQLQHHEVPSTAHKNPQFATKKSRAHTPSKPLHLAMKASHTPPLVQAEHK